MATHQPGPPHRHRARVPLRWRACPPRWPVLAAVLLGSFATSSVFDHDEFANPSHTPALQLLSPRHDARLPAGQDVRVVFAAPKGALVRILLDREEVARVSGAKYALLPASLFPRGTRLLQAELVDALGGGSPRDAAVLHFCECGQPSKAAAAAASALSISDGLETCGSREKALPALENPLEPGQRYMHSEELERFGRWAGELEAGYTTDWLGVRTRYAWDCVVAARGYYAFVPSRRLACEEYDRGMRDMMEQGLAPLPLDSLPMDLRERARRAPVPPEAAAPRPRVEGFLPPLDDEYPEIVAMLRSVIRSRGNHFVVVELGASYGTWGARGVAAARRLYPMATSHFVGVEPARHRFRQMEQHMLSNNMENTTLLHAIISSSSPPAHAGVGYATHRPPVMTLHALLAPHDHVDYLDLDIQGQEKDVFSDPASVEAVNEKVYALHIGAHSPEIHEELRSLFLSDGWILEMDYPHTPRMEYCDSQVQPGEARFEGDAGAFLQRDRSCLVQTEQGPTYVRDGILSFFNDRFGHLYDLSDVEAGS
mmetsp:Transcript_28208/g.66869  ORF Transcript_28208/g.66869 Transcript_28208/m.66869 type:complete len:541 (-) Transcript_28208:12-1634(-)